MIRSYLKIVILLTLILVKVAPMSFAADSGSNEIVNPCQGILSYIDRTTISDSPCVLPPGKVILEMDYSFLNVIGGGHTQTFPDHAVRIGLYGDTEILSLLPTYINDLSHRNDNGVGPTVIGAKHSLGYNSHWVSAAEILFTLPSGSPQYGSDGVGSTANWIINYSINNFSLNSEFGLATLTDTTTAGGGRYTTFNFDFVVSWLLFEKVQFYIETYGQTKSSSQSGIGINADTGFQYMFSQHVVSGFEVGHRLTGSLGGFDSYFTASIGTYF